MSSHFEEALKNLVELDNDAVEAYEMAINKLKAANYKLKLIEFKEDHERHIRELNTVLEKRGQEKIIEPTNKQWLTKGKVFLGSLIGDKTILLAMKSNEMDTNMAYERMVSHQDKWPETMMILQRGLEDERKHKAWLESVLNEG